MTQSGCRTMAVHFKVLMSDGCGKTFACWAEYNVDYVARIPLTERERGILRGAKQSGTGT